MITISKIINKFLKNSSQRELSDVKKIIEKINSWEPRVKEITDSEFPKKTLELKLKVKNGTKLDDLLPEAFAYVREAAKRTLGERH